MINIEIWASGSGSNAQQIIKYFQFSDYILVKRVTSNNSKAGVLAIAQKYNIDTAILDTSSLENGQYLKNLKSREIDFIILAGFLKLVPSEIVKVYQNRMLNIHPSLLPKYGGKNMYGDNVHKAVLENKESESGITIHLVNEEFDKGEILAQFKVSISKEDRLADLKEKIRDCEHQNFAPTIEEYILETTATG